MCEGIARAGRGISVFVGETEDPDRKLMNLLRAARGAPIENLSIDWGLNLPEPDAPVATPSALPDNDSFTVIESEPAREFPLSLFDPSIDPSKDVAHTSDTIGPRPITLPPPPALQVAPPLATLPSLYPGFRTSIFAIARRPSTLSSPPSQVVVRGTLLGRPVELSVPVRPIQAEMEVEGTKMVHVLAARALIQGLEDDKGLGLGTGAGAVRGWMEMLEVEVSEAQVRRLALRYGLASSQTSFVAVDEDGRRVASAPVPAPVVQQTNLFANVSIFAVSLAVRITDMVDFITRRLQGGDSSGAHKPLLLGRR
jgi:hypothetical protein